MLDLERKKITKQFQENSRGIASLFCVFIGSAITLVGLFEAMTENKISPILNEVNLNFSDLFNTIFSTLDQRTALEKTSVGCNLILLGRLLVNSKPK